MSWRLRLSVETILRLTPAVLGSTVFSIARLCAAHACLDDQALTGRARGHRLQLAYVRIPRFLAAADRSLTVPKEVRKTPLRVAISTGFHSLVELLLRHELRHLSPAPSISSAPKPRSGRTWIAGGAGPTSRKTAACVHGRELDDRIEAILRVPRCLAAML